MPLGRDGRQLAAFADDLFLHLGECPRIDPTIRTPVPTMENNGHWPLLKQLFEGEKFSILVGENKARH